MYRQFLKYCTEQQLFQPHERILLAVSGGIDSMVMTHLFIHLGQNIAIAHCNFELRGKESNGDEKFIHGFAQKHQIPFHTTRFNTRQYAEEHKISTQMAARDLRYNWFNTIATEYHFSKIAIAHHANDLAETLLLNLIRGTGLKGLCSMAPINGNIIRPLLFTTREEIQKYATENNISYREDHSNASDDYARNYIRHHIIPELESLNPSLVKTFRQNVNYFSLAHTVTGKELLAQEKLCCKKENETLHINIKALQDSGAPAFFLHEWLQVYGFNSTQIDDITAALNSQPGKQFYSSTHVAIKDREEIIVTSYELRVTGDKKNTQLSTNFQFSVFNFQLEMPIPHKPNIAWLDADKLQLPLLVRPWQDGDSFIPLGMKGKKKISDCLIDIKMPLHQKENQLVVTSGENIVWLVGQRIDDRYKISDSTKNIYQITWNENLPG